MSDFLDNLFYEQSQLESADRFYRQIGYKNIHRCLWEDPEGRILQKRDIDVILDGTPVSEKFRLRKWNDLCLEIYSDWEKGKDGSCIYSQAKEMFYFNGSWVIQLDMNKLRPKAFQWREHIHSHLTESQVRNLELRNPVSIYLPGNTPATLRSIPSHRGNKSWNGLCMMVEWNYLDDCIINDYKYERTD